MEFIRAATTDERLVSKFTRYLNGPMGRSVLEHLEEGESFLVQTSQHTFRVTKQNGKAIIQLEHVSVA